MNFKSKQIFKDDDIVGKTVKGIDKIFGFRGEVAISFTDGTFVIFDSIDECVYVRRDSVLDREHKIDSSLVNLGVFTSEEVEKYNSIVEKMWKIKAEVERLSKEIGVIVSLLPEMGTEQMKERVTSLSLKKIELESTLRSLDEEISKI